MSSRCDIARGHLNGQMNGGPKDNMEHKPVDVSLSFGCYAILILVLQFGSKNRISFSCIETKSGDR
ncbi:hypothetical protein BJX76DRAFT_321317 [Aspergillus varians]